MKQIHATLRLLICLLLVIAWARQPSPASGGQVTGAAVVNDMPGGFVGEGAGASYLNNRQDRRRVKQARPGTTLAATRPDGNRKENALEGPQA